ncbi:transposase [Dysgonomonas capnocytophagoides]|uniref:transposase n=1 Tax=Dysgonomonas capnocytophagoides TaxID=45254 RepID=UPI003340F6C6
MAKYSERLVEKIVRLIEEDTYTISEICDALRISRNSFYEWKNSKPEFCQALKDAEDRRDDSLAILARRSLREQLEGYVVTTEKIVYQDNGYGGETVKSKTVTRKKVAAKAAIIKLALERCHKKREEKKEKSKANIHENPIVLKFPKEVSQDEAVKMITDFRKELNRE